MERQLNKYLIPEITHIIIDYLKDEIMERALQYIYKTISEDTGAKLYCDDHINFMLKYDWMNKDDNSILYEIDGELYNNDRINGVMKGKIYTLVEGRLLAGGQDGIFYYVFKNCNFNPKIEEREDDED